jgi:hypothetical protein
LENFFGIFGELTVSLSGRLEVLLLRQVEREPEERRDHREVFIVVQPGVNVMISISGNFESFFDEKIGDCLENQCYDHWVLSAILTNFRKKIRDCLKINVMITTFGHFD